MAKFTNVFETDKEANMRLRNTVVMYDGDPYYVLCICNHTDGIFRIYLDPCGQEHGLAVNNYSIPCDWPDGHNNKSKAEMMDEWLATDDGKRSGVIRKMMNSPKFNKFRPFELGMINYGKRAIYIERQPTRKSEQGLTPYMLSLNPVIFDSGNNKGDGRLPCPQPEMYGKPFYQMVKGIYPTAKETIETLAKTDCMNESVAFDRKFAFLRGPLSSMFLAYKDEVVGVLPNADTDKVTIPSEFRYVKESVERLNLFNDIQVR